MKRELRSELLKNKRKVRLSNTKTKALEIYGHRRLCGELRLLHKTLGSFFFNLGCLLLFLLAAMKIARNRSNIK